MTDQPELKPCPFCGGEASVWTTDAYSCDSADHVIGCKSCDIYTPFAGVFESNIPSRDDVRVWNTRPDLSPQPPVTPGAVYQIKYLEPGETEKLNAGTRTIIGKSDFDECHELMRRAGWTILDIREYAVTSPTALRAIAGGGHE